MMGLIVKSVTSKFLIVPSTIALASHQSGVSGLTGASYTDVGFTGRAKPTAMK
jgi:hypothetical protein